MAAGPISERNQGDWRGPAGNGPRGAGRPRLGPAVFPRGWEIGSPRRAGDRPLCLLGAGSRVQTEACRCDALSNSFCLLFKKKQKQTSKQKPETKQFTENLQQNLQLDLRFSSSRMREV